MILKDKRTRRIAAACASAAVVTAGGVTVGASMAGANGSLSLSTVSPINALDLGAAATATASLQTLSASTGLTLGATFTLTYGGQTTTALAKTATASDIQDALNLLTTVKAAGGVTVALTAGTDLTSTSTTFEITFNVTGLRTAITTAVQANGGAGATAVATSGGSNTLGAGTLAQAVANATFGTKVSTTLVGALSVTVDSYTAPTGVTVPGTPRLLVAEQVSGSATGPTTGWLGVPNAGSSKLANTGDVFLTPTKPGTYTFHFSDDNNTAGTGDDAVSSTVTLNALDVEGATGSTADDWSPTVGMSKSTADIGTSLVASVPFSALTTGDTRASSGGVGVLGSKIAALVGIGFSGTPTGANTLGNDLAGVNAGVAVTPGATAGTRTLAAGLAAHAGTVIGTSFFDRNGDGTISDPLGSPGTTTIQTNGVSAVLLEPVAASSKVASGLVLTSGNIVVKTNGALAVGGTTVTLSAASGTDLTGHRIKISKAGEPTEYVTVSAGGTTTSLTTGALAYVHSTGSTVTDMSAVNIHNGTAAVTYTATVTDTDVDKSGNIVYFTLAGTDLASLTTSGTTSAPNVYSATTNSDGVASLTVTDGAATRVGYTVTSSSNNTSSLTLTAAYVDPRASIVSITTTGAALSPSVSAGQVTITGKLLDQFGDNFAPDSSGNQQIDVSGAVTAHILLNGGTFSYVYKPTTTPTAGSTDTLNFAYIGGGNPVATVAVNWASGTAVNAVTVVPASLTPSVARATVFPTPVSITGKASDSGSTGLAYKTVTLTGTQGVYFSSASTGANLVNTLDVATDSSGNYTVYAVFTRSGAGKITATSEGKTASADVVVAAALGSDGYTLNVANVAATMNSTVVISGRVNDVFGNAVNAATVNLSVDDITYGVLGSNTPTTNTSGDYSTTYITGSKTGKVFLSAKLGAGTAITPSANWLSIGGIKLPASNTSATGNVTIAADVVSLVTDKVTLVGGGNVTLTGNTRHGASVDVYMKVAGEGSQLVDSVTADGSGDFSVPVTVNRSASFFAKTSTATSTPVAIKVISSAKISARSIRYGGIRVSVSGGPLKTGTVVLWQRFRGGRLVKLATYDTTTGGASWKLYPGRGTKTYRATYTSTGSDTSAVVSVSIIL